MSDHGLPDDIDSYYPPSPSPAPTGTCGPIGCLRPLATIIFAAAVPIGGWGFTEWAERIVDRAIWAFNVAGDPVIKPKYTRRMIAAIRAAGGHPRHTEIPGDQHGFLLYAYEEPELLPWLFAQRLSG